MPTVLRPYVTSIVSNLKGLDPAQVTKLGPKTLIIGATGSKKSAIANAVELALSGKASDIMGRGEVAQEAVLMSMAPGRAGQLAATAQLSDGTTARWETSGTARGSAKKALHQLPPGVDPSHTMPMRRLADNIVADPDRARRFFLRIIAGDIEDSDVEAQIPAPLLSNYKSLLINCAAGDTPIDKLLVAAESAKAKARESALAAKAGKLQSDAAGQGLAAPASELQLQEAATAITVATAALEVAALAGGRAEEQQRLRGQVTATTSELVRVTQANEEAQHDVQALEGQLAALQAQRGTSTPSTLPAHLPALMGVMQAAVAGAFGDGNECPMCGAGHVMKLHDVVSHRLDYVKSVVEAAVIAQQVAAALDIRLERASAELEGRRAAAQTTINSRDMVQAQLDSATKELARLAPVDAAPVSLEEARKTLAAAQSHRSQLEARIAAWQVATRARDAAAAAETSQAEWKQLEKACDTAVEKLLDLNLAALCKRVQERMPKGTTFGMQLRDGNRSVFQVGFVRGGELVTALSGGEWAQMTAALADVCISETGPSVVVPYDRQMDAVTLAGALVAWGACESQVIVTSVVEPTAIPAGWTVIRMGVDMPAATAGTTDVQMPSGRTLHIVDVPADPPKAKPPEPMAVPPVAATPVAAPSAAAPAEPKPKRARKKKAAADAVVPIVAGAELGVGAMALAVVAAEQLTPQLAAMHEANAPDDLYGEGDTAVPPGALPYNPDAPVV